MSLISTARTAFHQTLRDTVLFSDADGVVSNADGSSDVSCRLASAIAEELGGTLTGKQRIPGQTAGKFFEAAVTGFLAQTFHALSGLRPGVWTISSVSSRSRLHIADYDQYAHLTDLAKLAATNPELAAALGSDYTITPDVIVAREPESDDAINSSAQLVDDSNALHAPLRKRNNARAILHASISCKWTIRSDRAQNSRAEALNLVKNRKGQLPHIAVVTAEPTPMRLASIALGTGEIDCVYHFALLELERAVARVGSEESQELLRVMVEGRRIRDIADLPLDLAT